MNVRKERRFHHFIIHFEHVYDYAAGRISSCNRVQIAIAPEPPLVTKDFTPAAKYDPALNLLPPALL